MTADASHDLVIIGSGIAGLTAAIAAPKAGLTALVIEKSDRLGGVTGWSYGGLWVASKAHTKVSGSEHIDKATGASRRVSDTIADNAANAGIVLGGRPVRPDAIDLRWVSALLHRTTRYGGVWCRHRGTEPP